MNNVKERATVYLAYRYIKNVSIIVAVVCRNNATEEKKLFLRHSRFFEQTEMQAIMEIAKLCCKQGLDMDIYYNGVVYHWLTGEWQKPREKLSKQFVAFVNQLTFKYSAAIEFKGKLPESRKEELNEYLDKAEKRLQITRGKTTER